MVIEEKTNPHLVKILSYLLIGFIFIATIISALRVFLIGANPISSLSDATITLLPDMVFAAIIITGVFYYFNGGKFNLILTDKLVLFFLLFNLVYGTIIATKIPIAARGFRLTYFPVMFYFIGRLFQNSKTEEQSKTTNIIFLWLAFQGLLSIAFHFLFTDFEASLIKASNHAQTAYFIPRMGGFVLTPVYFGTIMAITCIYFYYKLLSDTFKWYYIGILISWLCVFLTVSRGPILGFIIGFITLSVLFKKWKETFTALIIIALASASLSFILTGSFNILTWLFSSTADTLGMQKGVTRVMLWKLTWHDFLQRPYGYGLGHAGAMAVRFIKGTDIPGAVYSTDGWFLKIACETGIPGLISYLVLAAYFTIYLFRNAIRLKNTLLGFTLALFILINAQCVVANVLDFYPLISIFWLILGYSANIAKQQAIE